MVIRLKDAVIDSVDDTETRRLKLLKVSSKSEGATFTLELPDALCDALSTNDSISVVIDSKPIPKGEQAKNVVSLKADFGWDDLGRWEVARKYAADFRAGCRTKKNRTGSQR